MHTSEVRRPRAVSGLCAPALAWSVAGLAGWLLYRALGGPASPDARQIGLWSLAAGLTVLAGLALRMLAPARDCALRWTEFAAVGFGVAISAGWTIGVNLGGPLTGVATAVALAGCRAGHQLVRLLPVAGVGAAGAVLGRLLHGEKLTVLGLGVTLGFALAALGLALAATGRSIRWRPTAALVIAWGAAWVGAWFVTTRLVDPYSVPLSLAGEIVLAMGIGGWAVGMQWQRQTHEPSWLSAVRWTAWAAVAYGVAWGLAVMLWVTGLVPGAPLAHLDVGTSVALPFAVWVALLPTMRRLAPAGPPEPGTRLDHHRRARGSVR